MLQEQIDNIKITELKINRIINNIETKIKELSEEKNTKTQITLIDYINKERNKYITYYWASYIGYLKNIKDEKYITSEKIMAKYEGKYNNAVYKLFEVIDSLTEKEHIIKKYGKRFTDLAHNQKILLSSSPELFEEELSLRKEYRKLLYSITIDFNNEQLSLVKLNKYLQVDDEQLRKEAYDKRYEALLKISDNLKCIFNKLITVRQQIAESTKTLNYTNYGFIKMNRIDYTKEDLKIFKESVQKYFVPLYEKLKENQAKRLGEEKLSYYNASYLFKDGNAKAKYDIKGIIKELELILADINEEYSKLFKMMISNGLIDLEERENKSAGGITTFLPELKVPVFIKRYMDNSQSFISITHEFGHSLQLYLNKDKKLHENRWPTFDICEIHSTTMELLISDYVEKIYSSDAKKHLLTHYTNLIETLIRTCAVDDFQTTIYEQDSTSLKNINEIWKTIYKKYYPSNNYKIEYFDKGIMWQTDINRIDDPFYGIDYALATIYALSFYQKYQQDKTKGINTFTNFCKDGGEISFKEIATKYNLLSPFNECDIKALADILNKKIEKTCKY